MSQGSGKLPAGAGAGRGGRDGAALLGASRALLLTPPQASSSPADPGGLGAAGGASTSASGE